MRIISQDGNVDLPYESAVVICKEGVIRAGVNDGIFCMGVYSTPEKAQAVMKELRKAYIKRNVVNANKASRENHPGYSFVMHRVFRFPPDAEATQ